MDLLEKQESEWRLSYSKYDDAILLKSDKKYGKSLKELDQWYQTQLPEILKQRKEDESEIYLTKDELVRIVEWKLKRGKFRPGFLNRVNTNSESDIKNSTLLAFKELELLPSDKDDCKIICNAIKHVSSLFGIGFATATACVNREVPFMSDESLRLTKPSTLKVVSLTYTQKDFERLYKLLKEKSIELNDQSKDLFWTPGKCQDTIWAFEVNQKHDSAKQKIWKKRSNPSSQEFELHAIRIFFFFISLPMDARLLLKQAKKRKAAEAQSLNQTKKQKEIDDKPKIIPKVEKIPENFYKTKPSKSKIGTEANEDKGAPSTKNQVFISKMPDSTKLDEELAQFEKEIANDSGKPDEVQVEPIPVKETTEEDDEVRDQRNRLKAQQKFLKKLSKLKEKRNNLVVESDTTFKPEPVKSRKIIKPFDDSSSEDSDS
ncbi:hypothetical protein BC833DRAFT_569195 [Globomyces pollinis-pini]|nr:hypothetical protein BC833DRAFT_569195 [Globomyces pollinis-pini]